MNPFLIPLFTAFTKFTPVIPKEYWNVYSQEQLIKNICEILDQVCAYANSIGIQLNYTNEQVANLAAEFDKFKEGAFDEYYISILTKWVEDNMPEIISQAIKMTFFGLSSDGYFVAYVPQSWSDIVFDTGAIYGTAEYGRLILRMNVDGDNVIDNTGDIDKETLDELIKQVKNNTAGIARNNYTLYEPTKQEEE